MNDRPPPLPPTRRELLRQASLGFGGLALSSLLADRAPARAAEADGLHPAARHRAHARSVIFCYMSGGVSQVDSFDPKPRLRKEAGQPFPMRIERTMFDDNGAVFPSPFRFRHHGHSGLPVSELFPHIAASADELAVIRSMTSTVNEHAQANYFFHTGFPFIGHPSAGAWAAYGLGSASQELPAFVVLQSGSAVAPIGGVGMFHSAFLPSRTQASILRADADEAVRNIEPRDPPGLQRRRLDLVRGLNERFRGAVGEDEAVDGALDSMETAFRMQAAVPELCDLRTESPATRALYGLNSPDPQTQAYGRQALLARRLVERGVRFVELSCLTEGIGAGNAGNPWDQHSDLQRGHAAMAHQVDQPIGALLRDLRARGLLDRTLVVWAGEFGRTPFSQGSNGRDHDPHGFSLWMAGGGVRGGCVVGETDEYGYHVVDQPHTVWDLWATVLHLLGLDHEALSYRHAGRDHRLSDVHGRPIRAILPT